MHKDKFIKALQSHGVEFEPAGSENVGNFERTILGKVNIYDRKQVHILVQEANQFQISLFPFSSGMNWGYGSHLPIKNENVLVDLSRLNRILDLDLDHGTATIEPGVTQAQLADELSKQNSDFVLDVTGSSAHTSILGNALDRGIAYHGLRVNQLLNLEVLLGNQNLIRTGFGHFSNSKLAPLYSYGIGPSLDGLFFQSNFGIVLQGTVQLQYKPEAIEVLSISIPHSSLSDLIDRLRFLRRKGVIQGIPHLADQERMVSTVKPFIHSKNPRSIVESAIQGDWTLTASIQGDKRSVRSKKRLVNQELKSLGKLYFHSETSSKLHRWWSQKKIDWFATSEQKQVLQATQPLRGFHYGRPSNAGVAFLNSENPQQIDKSAQGFLLFTPLAPLCGENSLFFRDQAKEISDRHQVRIAMTLNLISDRVLEAVISIHFSKTDPNETQRAHRCVREMTRVFADHGFYPYRTNIDLIDEMIDRNSPYQQTLTALKKSLDPNEIISPGRYCES